MEAYFTVIMYGGQWKISKTGWLNWILAFSKVTFNNSIDTTSLETIFKLKIIGTTVQPPFVAPPPFCLYLTILVPYTITCCLQQASNLKIYTTLEWCLLYIVTYKESICHPADRSIFYNSAETHIA